MIATQRIRALYLRGVARLTEIGGRRLPFLRWSVWRMLFGLRRLTSEWQGGDGRHAAPVAVVGEHARGGDLDAVIRGIHELFYPRSVMMNVRDHMRPTLAAESY